MYTIHNALGRSCVFDSFFFVLSLSLSPFLSPSLFRLKISAHKHMFSMWYASGFFFSFFSWLQEPKWLRFTVNLLHIKIDYIKCVLCATIQWQRTNMQTCTRKSKPNHFQRKKCHSLDGHFASMWFLSPKSIAKFKPTNFNVKYNGAHFWNSFENETGNFPLDSIDITKKKQQIAVFWNLFLWIGRIGRRIYFLLRQKKTPISQMPNKFWKSHRKVMVLLILSHVMLTEKLSKDGSAVVCKLQAHIFWHLENWFAIGARSTRSIRSVLITHINVKSDSSKNWRQTQYTKRWNKLHLVADR